MVATKLQRELLKDLQLCPSNDLGLAQNLQHLYIRSIEITLEMLKVLEAQGSVMIGRGEFLPNRTSFASFNLLLTPIIHINGSFSNF